MSRTGPEARRRAAAAARARRRARCCRPWSSSSPSGGGAGGGGEERERERRERRRERTSERRWTRKRERTRKMRASNRTERIRFFFLCSPCRGLRRGTSRASGQRGRCITKSIRRGWGWVFFFQKKVLFSRIPKPPIGSPHSTASGKKHGRAEPRVAAGIIL